MEQQKMIEEMAQDLYEYGRTYNDCAYGCEEDVAEYLVKEKGYRKVEQGEWKIKGLPREERRCCPIYHKIICSSCGFDTELLQGKRYNYCPNCGAYMRKGE